jgi:hypothetical protein
MLHGVCRESVNTAIYALRTEEYKQIGKKIQDEASHATRPKGKAAVSEVMTFCSVYNLTLTMLQLYDVHQPML